MTVLVSGANGFVGSAVVRRLVASGYPVRALVRTGSDLRNLEGLAVERAVGDLTDPASLERALTGCQALVHVAADYRLWTPDPESIYASNVAGTRNIMQAAAEAGVERIVYTSSVATIGLRGDTAPADEDTPVSIDDMIGHYKRSKFLAEAQVRRLTREAGLPVVIVNPSTPVGPGDIKPTPTGRVIADAVAGRMPAYVDTGLNVVHVDDVAAGHLLALERGTPGRRYILGGENWSLKAILHEIAAIAGRPRPRLHLPHGVVLPLAYVSEWRARLLRASAEPRVTVDGVRLAKKYMYFTSERAVRELGYAPRPVPEALRQAVAWFQGERLMTR